MTLLIFKMVHVSVHQAAVQVPLLRQPAPRVIAEQVEASGGIFNACHADKVLPAVTADILRGVMSKYFSILFPTVFCSYSIVDIPPEGYVTDVNAPDNVWMKSGSFPVKPALNCL